MHKLCLCCQLDMSHKSEQAKYCSTVCILWMQRKHPEIRNCLQCGYDIFLTYKWKFCCADCSKAYYRDLYRKNDFEELLRRYSDRMYMVSLNSSKRAMMDAYKMLKK